MEFIVDSNSRLKKNILIIGFLLVSCFSYNGFSQTLALTRANSEYKELYYVKSSEILLKVAEKGFKSRELFEKLGNALYFNNRMEDANKWYTELVQLYEAEIDPEYFFRYAMTFKALEKYDEANKWLLKFNELKENDLRNVSFNNYLLGNFDQDSINKSYKLSNLSINTALSDFGSYIYQNKLYFASSKKEDEKLYSWNEQPYLDIFYADIEKMTLDEIKLGQAYSYYDGINSKFHDAGLTYFNDSIVFFTRNNYFKKRKFKDKKGTNKLTILKGNIGDTTKIVLEPLKINNKKYTIAHSVFNKERSRMFFSSDMLGYGQSDLFYINIDSIGNLINDPVNLGPIINTEGRESFPFLSDEGDLYFSSDGHYGFGGMDIFRVNDIDSYLKDSLSTKIEIKNLHRPINSSLDDFAFYSTEKGKYGFLSSNRKEGRGDDDIYFFSKRCIALMEGLVVDKFTQEILPGALVTMGLDGVITSSTISDKDGKFYFEIECNKNYLFRADKEDFISDEQNLSTMDESNEYEVKLELEKDVKAFIKGDDIAKILDLKPIYFDFDKDNIRPDAAVELEKVIEFMKLYPVFSLDIRSHTDSRGADAYNMKLSERRNRSTKNYIIEIGGIDQSRIEGRGYGESQLLNKCFNNVRCSEAEHQLNRRSEFLTK